MAPGTPSSVPSGVIPRVDLRGRHLTLRELRAALPRAEFDVEHAAGCRAPHRRRRARAGCPGPLRRRRAVRRRLRRRACGCPSRRSGGALDTLDPAVRAALEESIRRARLVHADQRRTDHDHRSPRRHGHRALGAGRPGRPLRPRRPGGLPVDRRHERRARPGGRRAEPRRRRARRRRDNGGLPHPDHPRRLRAARRRRGVRRGRRPGGRDVRVRRASDGDDAASRSDLVTGPGNIYVAAAKRLLKGVIGIDAEAGPTEIAILADDTADPVHVAADLISQAEHDPLAAAVLVTDSRRARRRRRGRAGAPGRRHQARRAGRARR